jgi:serine protease Do
VLFFALLAAADPLAELEAQQQRLFEQVAPSVVFVSSGGAFGSGVFVSTDGLVLTNAHVVGKASTVEIVRLDGTKLAGAVVERASGDVDLALVKLDARDTPVLSIAGDDLRVGSWVASVGHGSGGIWAFNVGMVSNLYPSAIEHPVFQTQIPLNPGSSGGPVVDRAGRVVGIVTAGLSNSNSINFAIRMDVATRTLSRLAHLCDCAVLTGPAGVPLFVDGKMVGTGPRAAVKPEPGKHEAFAVVGGKMCKKTFAYPAERAVGLESCP